MANHTNNSRALKIGKSLDELKTLVKEFRYTASVQLGNALDSKMISHVKQGLRGLPFNKDIVTVYFKDGESVRMDQKNPSHKWAWAVLKTDELLNQWREKETDIDALKSSIDKLLKDRARPSNQSIIMSIFKLIGEALKTITGGISASLFGKTVEQHAQSTLKALKSKINEIDQLATGPTLD